MGQAEDYIRVEKDDPNRCQSNGAAGSQCQMRATPGSLYCRLHGGVAQNHRINRNYRLTKFQARIEEFADNDKVKSLREEIGILRVMMEEIINRCNSSTDLILSSGKIADLVMRIEKLVNSCHRIEERTGMLLDKTAALKMADGIIEIIAAFVTPSILDNIALKILEVVVNAQDSQADSREDSRRIAASSGG